MYVHTCTGNECRVRSSAVKHLSVRALLLPATASTIRKSGKGSRSARGVMSVRSLLGLNLWRSPLEPHTAFPRIVSLNYTRQVCVSES